MTDDDMAASTHAGHPEMTASEIAAELSQLMSDHHETVKYDVQKHEQDDAALRDLYTEYDQHLFDDLQLLKAPQYAAARHATRVGAQKLRATVVSSDDTDKSAGDDLATDDLLDIDGIKLETVHDIHKQRQEQQQYELQRAQQQCKNTLQQIHVATTNATQHMHSQANAMHTQLDYRINTLRVGDAVSHSRQHIGIQEVKQHLSTAITKQQEVVDKQYGRLQSGAQLLPDGSIQKTRSTQHLPRILSLRVDTLRVIKNKLPGGQYVMCVTLYDRLGGHPLRWCKMPLQSHQRDKRPIIHTAMTEHAWRHTGKYWNLEMRFDQQQNALYICCPSRSEVRPGNCLLFELFQVRASYQTSDRVVAWSCFPLATPAGDLLSGTFRCPMVRGSHSKVYDRYSKMEKLVQKDIDRWLCNLYFRAHPVTVRGERRWNWKTLTYSWKLFYSLTNNSFLMANSREQAQQLVSGTEKDSTDKSAAGAATGFTLGGKTVNGDGTTSVKQARLGTPLIKRIASTSNASTFAARKANLASNMNPSNTATHMRKKTINMLNGVGDAEVDEATQAADAQRQRKLAALERAKELQGYQYNLRSLEDNLNANTADAQSFTTHKLHFLFNEIFADMTLNNLGTFECWSSIMMLILLWWARIYIHYVGQYYWLTLATNVRLIQYHTTAWNVEVEYLTAASDRTSVNAETLIIGTIANMLLFTALVLVSSLVQTITTTFTINHHHFLPDAYFRLLVCYGIMTVLDPLAIVLVDVMSYNEANGEYFRLYHSNGVVGAILAIVLGMLLTFVAYTILHYYVLHVHMNGRLLDLYERLYPSITHSSSSSTQRQPFQMPHDTEISLPTMRHIIHRASTFKGLFGTTRKVMIAKYRMLDTNDNKYESIMYHLSIYNSTLR